MSGSHNELSVYKEQSIVKRISQDHFILASQVMNLGANNTTHKYSPIIFVFQLVRKANHFAVALEAIYEPNSGSENLICSVETVGKKTSFKFSKKGNATLVIDPTSDTSFAFNDSFGGFLEHSK